MAANINNDNINNNIINNNIIEDACNNINCYCCKNLKNHPAHRLNYDGYIICCRVNYGHRNCSDAGYHQLVQYNYNQ